MYFHSGGVGGKQTAPPQAHHPVSHPLGPGHKAGGAHTCNLDIVNGDHLIQLQQELLSEGGQAGYEKPAVLPGEFLEETRGAQCCRERNLSPKTG